MAKDMDERRLTRVLAVSSSGGHWEQLMLLRDSFQGCEVQYAATMEGLGERSGVGATRIVPDFNANKPMRVLTGLMAVAKVVREAKPNVVISTGAAPGLIALLVGKMIGARTIWIDSVANSERLSLSGRMAGRIADLWVTQWEHLANRNGPVYYGAVL